MSKNGVDKLVVVKDEVEEVECKTKRSYPAARFSWTYQLMRNCTAESKTCPPAKRNAWRRRDPRFRVEKRSPNLSVLIVPAQIENLYFRCVAENPATGEKDSKQYQFFRIPRKYTMFKETVISR